MTMDTGLLGILHDSLKHGVELRGMKLDFFLLTLGWSARENERTPERTDPI